MNQDEVSCRGDNEVTNELARKAIAVLDSVTPKPDRRTFVNNEKVNKKYQFLKVRFSNVDHPTRYGEIKGLYKKI